MWVTSQSSVRLSRMFGTKANSVTSIFNAICTSVNTVSVNSNSSICCGRVIDIAGQKTGVRTVTTLSSKTVASHNRWPTTCVPLLFADELATPPVKLPALNLFNWFRSTSSSSLRPANCDVMGSSASVARGDFPVKYLKHGATKNPAEADAVFQEYDKDGKGHLSQNDFFCLLDHLFYEKKMSKSEKTKVFQCLDQKKEGKITSDVFKSHWKKWFRQVLDPVSALLVVDMQYDFITGSLALRDDKGNQIGHEIIPVINDLLDQVKFDYVVYTLDWHPKEHISFFENKDIWKAADHSPVKTEDAKMFDTVIYEGDPPVKQTLWPAHCVQDTEGAKLHKDLKCVKNAIYFNKGTDPDKDYYSAFKDCTRTKSTSLAADLSKLNITDVYTCGLVYDYCVGETTIDAVSSGFRTVFIEDAVRGVAAPSIKTMRDRLEKLNVPLVKAAEVADLIECKTCHPKLGLQGAEYLAAIQQNES